MSKATLQRRPLVKQLLDGADDNLLVIAGLGSSNWDITAAGDRPLNMPLWGSMGAPVGRSLKLTPCWYRSSFFSATDNPFIAAVALPTVCPSLRRSQ